MKMVAYPLYRQIGMGGMLVWALFERASLASNGDEELFGMLPPTVPPTLKDELIKEIRHRVRPRAPAKISAELEVTCFAYDGINAIRDVLRFGKCFGETLMPSIPLTVTVSGSPKYEISAVTEHEEEGLKRLGDAIEAMKTAMAERQGTVKVVQKPSRTDNGGIVMPQQDTEGVEVTPTSNVGGNRVERGNKKASAGYHRRHPAEGSRESLLGSNERF